MKRTLNICVAVLGMAFLVTPGYSAPKETKKDEPRTRTVSKSSHSKNVRFGLSHRIDDEYERKLTVTAKDGVMKSADVAGDPASVWDKFGDYGGITEFVPEKSSSVTFIGIQEQLVDVTTKGKPYEPKFSGTVKIIPKGGKGRGKQQGPAEETYDWNVDGRYDVRDPLITEKGNVKIPLSKDILSKEAIEAALTAAIGKPEIDEAAVARAIRNALLIAIKSQGILASDSLITRAVNAKVIDVTAKLRTFLGDVESNANQAISNLAADMSKKIELFSPGVAVSGKFTYLESEPEVGEPGWHNVESETYGLSNVSGGATVGYELPETEMEINFDPNAFGAKLGNISFKLKLTASGGFTGKAKITLNEGTVSVTDKSSRSTEVTVDPTIDFTGNASGGIGGMIIMKFNVDLEATIAPEPMKVTLTPSQ